MTIITSGDNSRRKEKAPSHHQAAAELATKTDSLVDALNAGAPYLDTTAVEQTRGVLTRTTDRLRLGADHTIVALAGSTGSGKSSLFNALTGLELSMVGARRPTTSKPIACVWGGAPEALLDWLDIPRRHRVNRESELDGDREKYLSGLILLDLPDHDSTEMAHRLEVDRLVELVDLLVWVADPQKYADDALHTDYLKYLVDHQDVMVMVLNQIDRVKPHDVPRLKSDLGALLVSDGLPNVPVITTSAVTGEGLQELRALLAHAVTNHNVVVQRAMADLRGVRQQLLDGVSESEVDPSALDGRDELVNALAIAAGVPALVDAVRGEYVRSASATTGWPFTRWVRHFTPDPLKRLRLKPELEDDIAQVRKSSLPKPSHTSQARVGLATRRVADGASDGLPERWRDAVREAANPPDDDIADDLDQAVVSVPLERSTPLWWKAFGFLQIVLAFAVVGSALWLTARFMAMWVQLEFIVPMPMISDVLPWPPVLFFGGIVLGLTLAGFARWVAGARARARGRRTQKAMHKAISHVADQKVIEPVAEILRQHKATREALTGPHWTS